MEHYRLITEAVSQERLDFLTEMLKALEIAFNKNGFFFLSVPDSRGNVIIGGFFIGDDTSIGDTTVAGILGNDIKYALYDAHTAELIYKNHG